ncbi:DNA primase small subunit-like protein [Dinothrombium tinctorium]|uniref:DNA primase n=1 Tax=Dinothrombium tinctorium TaxID=1965070 RepID=A0A3S3S8W2_9ACAR|nr:DNA primase small subunit-like protein [Dinothrombium tinctorium]
MDSNENNDFLESLRVYYKLLFPYRQFYKWLTFGDENGNFFKRREFSFTLTGDIYIRYQCFQNRNEMEKAIQNKLPEKIDFGAVYNIRPDEGKKNLVSCFPIERELIFDVDINDYDDVRSCCEGSSICLKCWPFLTIAMKILHRTLTEDFGFEHILFVFSGRRGIHCWVLDRRARELSDKARAAIVSYISLVEGGAYQSKRVNLDSSRSLHPSVSESLKIVDSYFESLIVEKQRFFDNVENVKKCIDWCTDPELKSTLSIKFLENKNSIKNSSEVWLNFKNIVEGCLNSNKNIGSRRRSKHYLAELQLQLLYPRLDANVSKTMNHLLKSPFSVHPKTGRVCVPIDIEKVDSFNPFTVPQINELIVEINEFDKKSKNDDASNVKTFEKTSLRESIRFFDKFVEKFVDKCKKEKKPKQDINF